MGLRSYILRWKQSHLISGKHFRCDFHSHEIIQRRIEHRIFILYSNALRGVDTIGWSRHSFTAFLNLGLKNRKQLCLCKIWTATVEGDWGLDIQQTLLIPIQMHHPCFVLTKEQWVGKKETPPQLSTRDNWNYFNHFISLHILEGWVERHGFGW